MPETVLSACVPPPLGCSTTRPDPSDAKETISPSESVRAVPLAVRVVPDMTTAAAAEEEEGRGTVLAVRVREPAARTRGVIVGDVVVGFELGE
jgi:hypothetical protein